MKKTLIILMTILMVSCSFDLGEIPADSNFSVITANLLMGNEKLSDAINDVLVQDADVVVLNEPGAVVLSYETEILDACYSIETVNSATSTFDVVLLVKNSITDYELGSVEYDLEQYPNPITAYATCRFSIGDKNITVVGTHFYPPSIIVKSKRLDSTEFLLENVENGIFTKEFGSAQVGDSLIFAGDLNMLASDLGITKLKINGLIDSHSADEHCTNMTWENFARIDYIFGQEDLNLQFSGTFEITGSDHRAVLAAYKL